MILLCRNRTDQRQQINLIGGDCLNVAPKGAVEIDLDKIYKDEYERLKVFFKFDKIKPDTQTTVGRNVLSTSDRKVGKGITVKILNLNYGGN